MSEVDLATATKRLAAKVEGEKYCPDSLVKSVITMRPDFGALDALSVGVIKAASAQGRIRLSRR